MANSVENGHLRSRERLGQCRVEFRPRALSIEPKLSKIWKRRQIVQKFPRKVSRNSGNCWISELGGIQPKILDFPGAKLNGKKTSEKKISKIWVYLARLPCFWKFWRMPFHSLLEVAENSNPTLWLNGKRPQLLTQSRDSQQQEVMASLKKSHSAFRHNTVPAQSSKYRTFCLIYH